MSEKFDYDLFVIGGGSGGVRAARIAAGHGARVAIAEEYRWGGTCVIRGCVPKKLFAYAARFHGEFEDAAGFGWDVGQPTFDWSKLVANKDKEIARLEGAYAGNLERAKVTLFKERAELTGPHAVRLIASARTLRARHVLVATGGRPQRPGFPGAELGFTSNEAFHLPELPASVVVQGGGYIAVEFASIFNGLGVPTTLLYRGPQILRGFDDDIRASLADAMRARGIDVRVNADIASAERTGKGLRLRLADGRAMDAGGLMLATGRVPNTDGLGLAAAGVALGQRGAVAVDPASRTNVPHIFAVGDVTDRVALTPVAIREGHGVADSLFGGKPWTVDHNLIPTAVFSEPEIGTVGLSEADAARTHGALDLYKARFRPMKFTLSGREERMLMKLIVARTSQKVVGCHVLGPDAAEIVQMAAIAMRIGATKADFDATMALHPSAAEELVTMREMWVPPKAAA